MITYFIFLTCPLAIAGEISFGLLTSEFTPKSLKDSLTLNLQGILVEIQNSFKLTTPVKALWENLNLSTAKGQWSVPSSLIDKNVKVIIDATSYPRYSQYLSTQAISQDFLHLVTDRPINSISGEVPSNNTLYTVSNYITQARALFDIIKTYNWQNISIIYDQDVNNIQMAAIFKTLITTPMVLLDEMILDINEISFLDLTHKLQSTLRASGARIIVVMASPEISSMLLQAADGNVMGGSGYAWILNSKALVNLQEIAKNSHADVSKEFYSVIKTGAIGALASDEQYLKENPLYPYTAILHLVISGFVTLSSISGSSLFTYCMSNPYLPELPHQFNFDSTGVKRVGYLLVNMNNFGQLEVGSWDEANRKYSLYDNTHIMWPGFTTSVPNDKVPMLKLCLLYPATDLLGKENPAGTSIKNGFDLAISEINSLKLIGDYQINVIYKDTLNSLDIASIAVKFIAIENPLAYIGPDTNSLTQSYLQALSNFTDPKPLISYAASDYLLSDSVTYGRFLRTIQNDNLQAVALAMVINAQGWKNIGVIYTGDNLGISIFSGFSSNLKTLGISILNTKDMMVNSVYNTDGSLADSTKSEISLALNDIVRNQVKIIVFIGDELLAAEIAKQAYDKELHGKDYSYVGSMWLTEKSLAYIDSYYADSKKNIMSVLEGALGLYFRPPQGTSGADFETNYKAQYGETYSIYSMLAYDTAYLLSNAIKGMISSNTDFTSGKSLMDSLRGVDFMGVSGKIKFTQGQNDRSAYGYSVMNIQNGSLIMIQEYDPLNPSMFTNLTNGSIIFGGGSLTQTLDLWPTKYDCPFASNMSKISQDGIIIIIVIGAFLFVITLILSYFSYKKWVQIEFYDIIDPVTRTWKDSMVQIQILVEFFQFAAIAPSFESLQIVVRVASNIFMLDVMKIAQSDKGDYWILLSAVCALCYSWFILVVLIMTNAEDWLKKVPICQRLLSIMNSLFLPFFGNTMFLPSLALLLDAFVCDYKAQGKPYVLRDCYMECWSDRHKPYIAMSALAIILYEPVAAFSRPLWQQAKTGLNIKIKPFFLLFKTCIQILLIAVGKALQGISPIAHGVIFSLLMIIFTVLSYKLRPFNYNRCNLWEFSSLLAVTYLSVIATFSYSGDSTNIGWFIGLAIGWAIIAGVSIWYQRKYMPNLLVATLENKGKHKVYDMISIAKGVDDEDDISKSQIYPDNMNPVVVQVAEDSRVEIIENQESSSSSENEEAVNI